MQGSVQITFSNTNTAQKNFLFAISLTVEVRKCVQPKGRGQEGGGCPGGRAGEELTGFYF